MFLTCLVGPFVNKQRVVRGKLGHVKLILTCIIEPFVVRGKLGHDVTSVLDGRSPKRLENVEARLSD